MPEKCPRCGYPFTDDWRSTSLAVGAHVPICPTCGQVEAMEMARLGQVLPVEKWAVND